MAEINWGLIDTQSPAKIANALMPSPEQQGAQALQVMQMQHAAGQNQVSQMQIQKMKQDAAGIAEFSRRSALLGGPSDPMDIAQAYLAHPDIEMKKLGLGLMEKAQNIAKYDKMIKDRAAAAATLRPAAMPFSPFDEINTPQNVAPVTNALPAQVGTAPPVTNALPAQVGTAPMSQSALLDQVRAEMADLAPIAGPHGDPRANLRLKSLEKTEAELVKGRVHTPGSVFTMPGVADVVTPAAPSPLARMQAERDALPLNDPRRVPLDAAINAAKVTQEQGAERIKQGAERNRIAQQRLQEELATGKFTPDTVDFLAETYKQTGNLPALGMGKAAAALRQQVLARAAVLARAPATGEAPISAADAAKTVGQNKQEFAGGTAGQRTLGTTLANVTSAATEAHNMIPIVEQYAKLVNPTDFPAVNAVGNFVARQGGGESVVGLAASLNALVNAYARAINPKGVATVSDKNHAREIINSAMSSGQINTALNVMRAEMLSAMAAPKQVKESMRQGSTTSTATPAAGKPPLTEIFK